MCEHVLDDIQNAIQQEKTMSNDLDRQIRTYEKKLRLKQIELTGKAMSNSTSHDNVRRQEQKFENRLDTVSQSNEVTCRSIDSLVRRLSNDSIVNRP
jgi:hypothetical protein